MLVQKKVESGGRVSSNWLQHSLNVAELQVFVHRKRERERERERDY